MARIRRGRLARGASFVSQGTQRNQAGPSFYLRREDISNVTADVIVINTDQPMQQDKDQPNILPATQGSWWDSGALM